VKRGELGCFFEAALPVVTAHDRDQLAVVRRHRQRLGVPDQVIAVPVMALVRHQLATSCSSGRLEDFPVALFASSRCRVLVERLREREHLLDVAAVGAAAVAKRRSAVARLAPCARCRLREVKQQAFAQTNAETVMFCASKCESTSTPPRCREMSARSG